MKNTIYVGSDAIEYARHKARYGHRDWFYWRGKDGLLYAARVSAESCKMAMLATGTQGRFTCVGRDGILLSSSSWAVATAWFANLKAGFWY